MPLKNNTRNIVPEGNKMFRRTAPYPLLPQLAVMTYIIGDSLSAAKMMDVKGVQSELNPLARRVYLSHGELGLIMVKSLYLLGGVVVIKKLLKSEKVFNSFLLISATTGLLATLANIKETNKEVRE